MRELAEVSVTIHEALWSGRDMIDGDSGTHKVRIHPKTGSRYLRIVDPDLGIHEWFKQGTHTQEGHQRKDGFAKLVALGNSITWYVDNGRVTGQGVVNGEYTDDIHQVCMQIVQVASQG
jgi:hypothetical protein